MRLVKRDSLEMHSIGLAKVSFRFFLFSLLEAIDLLAVRKQSLKRTMSYTFCEMYRCEQQ